MFAFAHGASDDAPADSRAKRDAARGHPNANARGRDPHAYVNPGARCYNQSAAYLDAFEEHGARIRLL
jgi:hypothetical protein